MQLQQHPFSIIHTQSLCHRPVTGFRCVQEAHFTSKGQLKLWPVRNIKIFHDFFWNCLGWKGPVVVPPPTPSCMGRLLGAISWWISKDGEPPPLWVVDIVLYDNILPEYSVPCSIYQESPFISSSGGKKPKS